MKRHVLALLFAGATVLGVGLAAAPAQALNVSIPGAPSQCFVAVGTSTYGTSVTNGGCTAVQARVSYRTPGGGSIQYAYGTRSTAPNGSSSVSVDGLQVTARHWQAWIGSLTTGWRII